jgi:predicted transcriptional regulator
MKRDMDLCREILRRMEEYPGAELPDRIEIDGKSVEEVSYHVMLLDEAGFIEAIDASSMGGIDYIPQRLTWEGHEFIEAARDDSLWKKAKDTTLSKAGGLTLDVLKAVLIDLAKRAALGGLT